MMEDIYRIIYQYYIAFHMYIYFSLHKKKNIRVLRSLVCQDLKALSYNLNPQKHQLILNLNTFNQTKLGSDVEHIFFFLKSLPNMHRHFFSYHPIIRQTTKLSFELEFCPAKILLKCKEEVHGKF